MSTRKSAIALAMLVLVVASPIAGMATALNFTADAAQNPEIDVDVTKATHEMGWSAAQYEGDDGQVTTMPATVNESVDNPYSYALDGVNESDFGAFPHKKDNVSALEASEWSKDVSGTAGTASIADVNTEPGVDAVSLSTSSQTSGDTAVFTFDNFSITSDANKRMLQVGMNINTLESGATVSVRAVDADGDYKEATANTSQTGGESEIASATGDGYMFQRQMGDLTTQGSGDGSFDEIQKVEVHVSDANADMDIYALNADKFSMWNFGAERVDTDGDGDLETSTIYEVNESDGGAVSITDLETIGSTFDDAELHDVTIPMLFQASELSDDKVSVEFDEATNFPSFEWRTDTYYTLTLPDAYDLSYANAELKDTVAVPGSRYQTVEYAEGVSDDTEYENISSWSDVTSSYSSVGANVSLDSTVTVGSNLVLHYDYVVTDDEKQSLENDDSSSSGGGVLGGGSGGFLDMVLSLPGAIVGGLIAFVGGRRLGVL